MQCMIMTFHYSPLYHIWLGKLEVHKKINNVNSQTASLVIGLCAIYIKLRVSRSQPYYDI